MPDGVASERPVPHLGAGPGSGVPSAPPAPGPRVQEFTELTTRHLGPIRSYFARHPVVMDILIMAWFGVPALLTATITGAPGTVLVSQTRALIWLAAVLLGVVALWWRRRAPEVVLAVVSVLGVITIVTAANSGGFELASALAIYAVAAARGPGRAWVAYAVSTVLLAGASILTAAPVGQIQVDGDPVVVSDLTIGILTVSLIALFNLVGLAIGNGVFNRRRHIAALVDHGNRLALERDQREQLAVADERTRIARELHDVVAHSLTVMITLSEGAAGIAERDPARSAGVMREAAETGRSALSDMRRVVGALRSGQPTGSDDGFSDTLARGLPLAPAPTEGLDELVARFRSAGLAVTASQVGDPLPADAGLRLAVYRIAQEALTNVLRYAPLSPRIEVAVERSPGRVVVAVLNAAGPGNRTPVPGSGHGLIGMRERVAVFNGTLTAGPTPSGWSVRAEIPWEDEA